jgi:hypothetical protein
MPDDRLGGEDGMTVDHFRPECRYPELRLSWSNLYYACAVCNGHYKKDHPTAAEEAEGKRFVDPCAEDPDDHFRLVYAPDARDLYRVRALSPAAEYVVFRLKLNQRKSLRDFWRLLGHEESCLLRREKEIRQMLELLEAKGQSDELQRIRDDFRVQLNEALAKLDSVRLLRPFPIE